MSKHRFFRNSPFLFRLNHHLSLGLVTLAVAIALGGMLTKNAKQSLFIGLIGLSAAYSGNWMKEKQYHRTQKLFKTALSKEIQDAETRLEDLEHYEDQLYQAIASAQAFSQVMEMEVNQLRTERFYLVDQISTLHNRRQEFYNLFAELQPKKQALENILTELSQKIEQTTSEKDSLEKRLIETTYNMKLIENSCSFIREELEQLHDDVTQKIQYKETLKQEIQELEKKTSIRAFNLDKLMAAESHLQAEVKQVTHCKDELEETCQRLKTNLVSLQKQEKELDQTLVKKQEEISSLETCLNYLKHEYDYLQTDVLDAHNQVLILTENQDLPSLITPEKSLEKSFPNKLSDPA